jgi:hypothetical protein
MMNIDWQPLSHLLHNVYSDLELSHHFASDAAYLKSAFDFTEALWHRQLAMMSDVKIVMLSEAPLFGNKQTYIYNPHSPPTAFFHFNDLQALSCNSSDKKALQSHPTKKAFLVDQLAEKGLIVMDIFPFAFNPNDAAINYRKMSNQIYFRLLSESAPYYLIPKIQLVREKAEKSPLFVYRYKKLFQKTNRFVEALFVQHGIKPEGFKIESIHGENMSLDRNKLKKGSNPLLALERGRG